jgi:hypothetical protein
MRAARSIAAAAAALLALAALGAHDALAKAPKEAPTVEDLYRQALTAIEDKKKRDAEAAKDPLKEAIDAYRDRKIPFTDYQKLVDIINDAKSESVQPYRQTAASALVTRFSREDDSDQTVKSTRRAIALAVIDLMKAPKDDVGVAAIEYILTNWWRMKTFEFKFKVNDKVDERKRAWTKMKKYLEKGEV